MVKEWKMWQEMYHKLVTDHSDAGHKHERKMDEDKVFGALFYLCYQSPVGIYPGKSRMVAIIYATMLSKVYGEDFYQVLNDPDLLYGQDDFFVPYDEDRETYDAIFNKLQDWPDWMECGWAPKTVEYFYLECTEKGFNQINGIV